MHSYKQMLMNNRRIVFIQLHATSSNAIIIIIVISTEAEYLYGELNAFSVIHDEMLMEIWMRTCHINNNELCQHPDSPDDSTPFYAMKCCQCSVYVIPNKRWIIAIVIIIHIFINSCGKTVCSNYEFVLILFWPFTEIYVQHITHTHPLNWLENRRI